jgi:hypothetical protein
VQGGQRQDRGPDGAAVESDLNDLARITEQQIPIANEVYGNLSAITPPSDLQSDYDAYLANGKTQIGHDGPG